jgi:hypothetical protein
MNQFCTGDVVRVASSSSDWIGVRGVVVEVVNRNHGDGLPMAQECAVTFRGERRWFMAEHLLKEASTNMVRFFQAEAIERWHLDEALAKSLDGRRDQLITVLQDCYGFSLRRAGSDVDEFVRFLDEKIRRATQVS